MANNTSPGYVGNNTAAYINFALHQTLFSVLTGQIYYSASAVVNSAELDGTNLVEAVPFPLDGVRKPLQNLRELIEQLHINATISLLAIDDLVYIQPDTAEDMVMTTYQNVFHYDKKALLLPYCLALLLGLLALLTGTEAIVKNGVGMNVGFLSILTTTRNKTLDDLALGACLGAQPMPKNLGTKTRVKFGATETGGAVVQNTELSDKTGSGTDETEVGRIQHTAFGVEGIDVVEDIQKGVLYK
jgi:hypothetical protein